MTQLAARISEPTARRGARASVASALLVATAAACGSVASPGVDAGRASDASAGTTADAVTASALKLENCPIVKASRPASNSSADAPRLGKLTVGTATAGQPLPGTLKLPAQSTATTLIVQVSGQTEHLACALSPGELSANQIDLSRLSVAAGSGTGNYLVYFGLADAKGNVSGYAVGTVAIGAVAPIAICGGAPFQVLGRAFNATTATYTAINGTLADYAVSGSTASLSIITQSRLFVDTGSCTHLWLGSEPTAAKPVGWDNFLLVEYRSAPGAAVGKAWFYGGAIIVGASASQTIVHELDPTISGMDLDPQVPSTGAFGYPAKAIDLMTQVSSASHTFELTLYLLDFGGSGSATDVWLFTK